MKVIKSIARYVIFLFRGSFFHYNVMIFYYSINSPLSQFSPNLQQKRSVFSVCRRRSVGQRPLPRPLPKREGSDHRDTHVRKRPLPRPLPKREGSDHRDTPMANHQHLTLITQHPALAVTFCEFCMPEAFCGIEMCAKMFCYICEFCERKKYPS